MFRFTILNIIQTTFIVATCCRLAMFVGWDELSTCIFAMSGSAAGIGLWCYVTGR